MKIHDILMIIMMKKLKQLSYFKMIFSLKPRKIKKNMLEISNLAITTI